MKTTITPLPLIKLRPVQHRNSQWILIDGEDARRFNTEIKNIPGRKFSATYRCWLLLWNRESYNLLIAALQNKAVINNNAIKIHLRKQAKVAAETASPSIDLSASIAEVNKDVLLHMLPHLHLKSYSTSTIRTYMSEMTQFLKAIKGNDARKFTTQRLRDYLQYCYSKLNLSENTIHSRMNTIKFYYEQILNRERLFGDIPRPKKPVLLPKLLN